MKVTKEKKKLAINVFEFILNNWEYFERKRFYSAQSVIYISSKLGEKQADVMAIFNLVAKSTEWAVLITAIGHTRGNIGRMVEYIKSLRVKL